MRYQINFLSNNDAFNFMRLRYQNHLNSSIDQLQMYVVSYALTKGSNSDIEWKLILILLS